MQTMASRVKQGLAAAIAALNDKNGRGGAAKLAAGLDISHAAISQWTAVPLARVLDVERVSGVARSILRPDHFGETPSRKKAA